MADDSILDTTKQLLGIEKDVTDFDTEILIHINSVFDTFHQLGLGPGTGFKIEDSSKLWSEYIQDTEHIESIRSLMYLRIRLLFDPPATSFGITAFEKEIEKMEWRLNVQVDPGV